MVTKNRIQEEFVRLNAFDSETFHERDIAEYIRNRLQELGLAVTVDDTAGKLKDNYPDAASNIYGFLRGNTEEEPVLFSAHLDTVSPGKGKKVVIHENGIFTSDGTTILGADDISGIVSILEALSVIQEKKLNHPDIEILFTVAEEFYCEGSKHVDYDRLQARRGYVLDLVGPIGRAAVAAPSIFSIIIKITGKAAHAGFAPEKGINALSIAANALSRIPTGHINESTTVNFGTIHGGTGNNIVPEQVTIEGEVRSLDHENAIRESNKIKEIFEAAAQKLGGQVEVSVQEHIKAYKVNEEDSVVKRFRLAVGELFGEAADVGEGENKRCQMPECITTYGGSDANRLNEHGISTIVVACAMENVHSTTEYTDIDELIKSAELTLKLMTIED